MNQLAQKQLMVGIYQYYNGVMQTDALMMNGRVHMQLRTDIYQFYSGAVTMDSHGVN
jgi:hypothetical protein